VSGTRFWAPVWRSRPQGHRHLRLVRFLAVGGLTLVLPALVMFLLSLPFGILARPDRIEAASGLAQGLYEGVAVVMFLVVFAPIYGIVLVPLAMACLAVAMRLGYAGWAVAGLAALVCAALLGAGFALADGEAGLSPLALFMVPVTLVHALVLWGGTRWLLPETLLPAPE